jgi:hypothetical protein
LAEIFELVHPQEDLGRGVFSSKNAKRAKRSRVPAYVFLEKLGETKISVDRLSVAPLEEVAKISERVAVGRGASFYGWAIVAVKRIRENRREVIATPLPNNPYHADILLPEGAAEEREEQQRHAQELADASHWQDRPSPRRRPLRQ